MKNDRRQTVRPAPRVAWCIACAVFVVGFGSGCVKRGLWVRSEPAGARVFLDGAPVGSTPVRVPFAFYGTREVALRAPGYEPARLRVELASPWYAWPGLDLVSELLLPWTISDEHLLEVRLIPAASRPLEGLRTRAETMRATGID